ncbi:transposase [Providencia stuartii MRSN 2154]|uniref:Transposase n=1 Tax=Providencia stuartii (strain MRSN 2154) TaxID=1157951 RepID=A0A140NNW2_PROSM|nr:transposase [Providencia stuartii MRSN 2154]
MKYIPVGIDISKHLMQIYFIDEYTGEIIDKHIKCGALLEYLSNCEPYLICMEACGDSLH